MGQMLQTMNVKAREGEQGEDRDDGGDVLVAKRQSLRCAFHILSAFQGVYLGYLGETNRGSDVNST